MPTTLGALIKSRRDQTGQSQPQVAEILGVPQGTISRWERDGGAPRDAQVPPLAEWLGVDDAAVIAARYEGAKMRRAGENRTPLQQCRDELESALERVRLLEADLRKRSRSR